ncbi:MAG: hypothetical protein ACRBCL_09570 [Maritimibacter sp.]
MTIFKVMSVFGGAAIALSGCGVATALELVERLDEVTVLETNVLNAAATDDLSGRNGTASYTGQAVIGGSVSEEQVAGFSADATVDVNFDRATATGEMTNFIGSDMTPEEVAAIENGTANVSDLLSAFSPATGTAALENGTISGTSLDADTSGTITMKGVEYVLSGGVTGGFKGANATGVQLAQDTDFMITRDGVALTDPTILLLGSE